MRAKKKTVFKGFDYMHCDDFARYLSEMAAKGWHFKEWGLGLKFEQGEPEQVTYAVEVFTDASEYDLRPEPNTTLNFAEYCREAGWELVDAKQKFCIFKKVQEDAVPILTPEERLTNVCKENRLPIWTNLICHGLMVLMAGFDLFGDLAFEMKIFSESRLYFFLFWAVMFLESLYKAVSFGMWKWRRKKQLQAEGMIYIGDEKKSLLREFPGTLFLITAVILVWCLNGSYTFYYVGGLLVVLLVFVIIMNKVRPDSDTHFIAQAILFMVIFVAVMIYGVVLGSLTDEDHKLTEAPLIKVDYSASEEEMEGILLYEDSNVFGSRESYIVQYSGSGSNDLFYDIFTCEYEWIQNRIWNQYLEAKSSHAVEDCRSAWHAEEAFRTESGKYFVRYQNIIFTLNESEGLLLSQEQIDIIREKLDLR